MSAPTNSLCRVGSIIQIVDAKSGAYVRTLTTHDQYDLIDADKSPAILVTGPDGTATTYPLAYRDCAQATTALEQLESEVASARRAATAGTVELFTTTRMGFTGGGRGYFQRPNHAPPASGLRSIRVPSWGDK